MNNVTKKMAAGIAWMSLTRIGIKALALVNTVVLARLLVPADFGIVAMAVSVIAGLELFRAFNFDLALIQRQHADRSLYDTAWTFNVLLGLVLALALAVAAFPAATFFNEPRLASVIHALTISVLVSGFENIGVIAFRKDLAFSREFALRMVQKACATAITLPLAFYWRSYWALVVGMVSGDLFSVLISYYAHPFRPRFSLKAWRDLFSFSKWLLANNVLWFLRDRSPDYLLGRLAGAGALGLFTISFEISNLPTSERAAAGVSQRGWARGAARFARGVRHRGDFAVGRQRGSRCKVGGRVTARLRSRHFWCDQRAAEQLPFSALRARTAEDGYGGHRLTSRLSIAGVGLGGAGLRGHRDRVGLHIEYRTHQRPAAVHRRVAAPEPAVGATRRYPLAACDRHARYVYRHTELGLRFESYAGPRYARARDPARRRDVRRRRCRVVASRRTSDRAGEDLHRPISVAPPEHVGHDCGSET